MDKILAKKIADDSIKALESVAAKYGLKVKYHVVDFLLLISSQRLFLKFQFLNQKVAQKF